MPAPLPLLVVTTVGTREEAQALARVIVGMHLAACVQIEPIESVYRWRGQVYEDAELRLLFKTVGSQYAQIEAAIRAHHPYELPAIHAVATQAADPVYAAWVAENSGGPGDRVPIGGIL